MPLVLLPWVLLCWALPIARPLAAQPPLFLVDEATEVRSIAFRFDSTQSFDAGELQAQLVTTEPSFVERVKRILPLTSAPPHPLDPLELQRDIARLRVFYRENGFPHARITYADSRLDTARNTIRIAFSVDEGPAVRVRSLAFVDPAGASFPAAEADAASFQKAVAVEIGDRYSTFERLRVRSTALAWLGEQGYAFARVTDRVAVDTAALAADFRYVIDPGPLTYVDSIEVEGHTSVRRNVILRELPFRVGDRFSSRDLTQGQRELFALGLFRTALTEVPEQPRDSTARLLVRVREARAQLVTYEAGYGRETGLIVEGDWTHRNFLGDARTLSAHLIANTGYGATPAGGRLPARLFHATVALRQPYLFTTKLSATLGPFVQYERDQQLQASDAFLGLNTRELGASTTLLYEVLPFRTVSLQYTFSRVLLFTAVRTDTVRTRDPFNRSILTLSGTFGRSDDYINPARGMLVRPVVEMAGRVFGSGVQYYKAGTELTAYTPLTRRTGLAGRVYGGRLWPTGESADQDDPVVENRFDPIRFYVGGGSDLRGWADRLAGPKVVRLSVLDGDTLFAYEAVGGLAKLAANAELRLPFPGLGANWGTAVFAGAGRVGDAVFSLADLRYGTGAGIRYRTPVGFVRLDVAYKLNPDPADLRDAEAFYRIGTAADAKWTRRFMVHLSIGQAF